MNIHINGYIWNALFLINPALAETYCMLVACINTATMSAERAISRRDDADTERKACNSVLSVEYITATAMWWNYDGIRESTSREINSYRQVIETLCKSAGVDITEQALYTVENT